MNINCIAAVVLFAFITGRDSALQPNPSPAIVPAQVSATIMAAQANASSFMATQTNSALATAVAAKTADIKDKDSKDSTASADGTKPKGNSFSNFFNNLFKKKPKTATADGTVPAATGTSTAVAGSSATATSAVATTTAAGGFSSGMKGFFQKVQGKAQTNSSTTAVVAVAAATPAV